MTVQLTNVYRGSYPHLPSIQQQVPQHGNGRLHHQNFYGDYFVFWLAWNPQSESYDVFIEQQPDYGDHPSGSADTHRNGLLAGRPYICFASGKEPCDLPSAIMLAMIWAERTSRYIRDGIPWS